MRHMNLGCAGIILLALSMLCACRAPEDSFTSLRGKLQAYTDTLDAQVGIALLTSEAIIAHISKLVYTFFLGKQSS